MKITDSSSSLSISEVVVAGSSGGPDAADVEEGAVTPTKSKPLLEAVLDGERRFPLTQDALLAFLHTEKVDELARFYYDVKAFRALAQKGQNDGARNQAKLIINKYIAVGAAEEINISDGDRKATLAKAEDESMLMDVTLFDPALKEVTTMLRNGAFDRFIYRVMHQNITEDEAYIRYRKGFIWLAIAAIVFGGIVALQLTVPSMLMPGRWIRIVIVVPLSIGFTYTVSAACRVCTDLAYRHTRMTQGDRYTKVDSWQKLPGRDIVDDLAKRTLENVGTWVFWKAQLWAIFYTIIAVALPPGYGICTGGIVC